MIRVRAEQVLKREAAQQVQNTLVAQTTGETQ